MKNIYVKQDILQEAVAYLNNEMTFFGFLSHVKAFLKTLLTNPLNADIDDYLKDNGLNRKDLINALLKRGIVEKETKIDDSSGKDMFSVSYKIPKRNFERKMRRFYSSIFEKNEISESILSEEGEAPAGGGASTCSSVMQSDGNDPNSGQYVTSLTKTVLRRKIGEGKTVYINEEQAEFLKEMGTSEAGDYQYDVPFKFNNGKDPAYDHRNMMAKSFPKRKKKGGK